MNIIIEFFQKYGIMIISSIVGSTGFCLFFHVKKDKVIYGVLGSIISILALFIGEEIGLPLLLQNLQAAFVATIYAEIIARIVKAPATVFIISSIIPLTPGGALYYTMSAAVDGDKELTEQMAAKTGTIALGIALGIVLVSMIFFQLTHRDVKQKVKYQKYVKGEKRC